MVHTIANYIPNAVT